MFMHPQRRIATLMPAIVPQFDIPSETTVRRLVEALAAIPDRRGRVYSLSSLLVIYLLVADGDGNSPEAAADFARDHTVWLRRLGLLGDRIPGTQTLRCLLRTGAQTCWRSSSPWWSSYRRPARRRRSPKRKKRQKQRSRRRAAPLTARRCAARVTRTAVFPARTSSRPSWTAAW